MGRRKIIDDDTLLARARDVFMAKGIGVGSRRLAHEIGVSNSVLFQRFGSMEELFFAAMTPPTPDLATLLGDGGPPDRPGARLEHLAAGLLTYFRQLAPVMAALTAHPSFHYPTFARRHPDSALEQLIAGLIASLGEQHRRGEIDCPDPGPVVIALVAQAYGLAMFERIGVHEGTFSPRVVHDLAQVLWHGIAPEPASAKTTGTAGSAGASGSAGETAPGTSEEAG